jgi:hypothetical protein
MLVFVDESGDQGMQEKRGSSLLFIITAVIFLDNDDAQACDQKIDELRRRCFGNDHQEFKFNKCCYEHRLTFLNGIVGFDFLYLAFVLNKSKLHGPGFQQKDSFYKYPSKLLFENEKAYLSEATVVIDGSGNREFRRQLQTYLKRKINTEALTIRKVKTEASHANNLLQLADMVCGAVARSYREGKEDRFAYRKIIGRRELKIIFWPKN